MVSAQVISLWLGVLATNDIPNIWAVCLRPQAEMLMSPVVPIRGEKERNMKDFLVITMQL